ncbi:MAG TPA: response regulator transcription factor, partial [Bacteroidia bacterium]
TIEGFSAGGDDYITKPFSTEELLARIQAVLRRSMRAMSLESTQVEFVIGKYKFNTETQVLKGGTENVKLTTKEGQLLRLLAINKNDVLDRSFALKTIWQDDNYFNSRSMDVYITKLRKYFKQDPKVEIVNIHGKGFKLLVNP